MDNNPITLHIPQGLEKEASRLSEAADWRPVMAQAAELLHGEIRDNIRKGGRPTPFKPLNRLYKAEKVAAGYNPLPLRRTLALFNSLTAKHTDKTAEVGTNLIYAAIHHYGGEIKPRTGRALSFFVGRGKASKRITLKKVTIPARPYMLLTEDSQDELTTILDRYIKRILAIGGNDNG